jgi:hypothetical protein
VLSGTAPTLTYAPNPNCVGIDTFTFRANDGIVDSNLATVTITIAPVNDPPLADDQAVTTQEDTPVAVTLTASDVEDDALTFAVIDDPANGVLSGQGPSLTYTPDPDYAGVDTFTFRANDGIADSSLATVTITIDPVNDPPLADDQVVTTQGNTPADIILTASDVDGDVLTFAVVDGPINGALSGESPTFTYTPDPDYTGADTVTFRANDGIADSNLATVTIIVDPVNIPPLADDLVITTKKDIPVDITLTASDANGDVLTFTVVDGPANGVLSGQGPSLTYIPATNYAGVDTFTFRANDGQADSNLATVTITVLVRIFLPFVGKQ